MSLRCLYPETVDVPLEGLYIGLNLHHQAGEGELLIYSNYIASVDGRISQFNVDSGDYGVPMSLANKRDWRLYQELAAQSDILITSARYFRQLATGVAQDMLPLGSGYQDLIRWRQAQGLSKQPAVAILSRSLDIPPAAIKQLGDRDIYVFTSAHAPADKKAALVSQGAEVMVAGVSSVEGKALREALIGLAFKSAYMIAGPEVHQMLIADGVLDQLFLSTRFTLLGSEKTHGFCEGGLATPQGMDLQALYLDQQGKQLFSHYILER